MKIGIDVSLMECWNSGYMIMDFLVKKLYPNGRKNGIDPKYYVYFYRSDGGYIKGIHRKIVNMYLCWEDLLEFYNRYQKEIDSMCGYDEDNPRPGLDKPDEYVMVNLASDIDAYCGLE